MTPEPATDSDTRACDDAAARRGAARPALRLRGDRRGDRATRTALRAGRRRSRRRPHPSPTLAAPPRPRQPPAPEPAAPTRSRGRTCRPSPWIRRVRRTEDPRRASTSVASHYPNCWRVCRSVRPEAAGAVVARNELISSRPSGTRDVGLERMKLMTSARSSAMGTPNGFRPARLAVGIISAGRVGTALGVALERAEHVVVACSAISRASRQRAERRLPDTPVMPVDEVARRADLLLLAVPDAELAGLVAGPRRHRRRCDRAPSSCTPPAPTASPC